MFRIARKREKNKNIQGQSVATYRVVALSSSAFSPTRCRSTLVSARHFRTVAAFVAKSSMFGRRRINSDLSALVFDVVAVNRSQFSPESVFPAWCCDELTFRRCVDVNEGCWFDVAFVQVNLLAVGR